MAPVSSSQQTGAGHGIHAEALSSVSCPTPALPETRQPVPAQRELVRKEEVFRLLNIAKNFIFQYFLSQRIPEPVLCPRYGRVGAGFDLSGSL